MLTEELLPTTETKQKKHHMWSVPGHKDDLYIFSHVSLKHNMSKATDHVKSINTDPLNMTA